VEAELGVGRQRAAFAGQPNQAAGRIAIAGQPKYILTLVSSKRLE
jgi:hypothetical protein